MEEEVKSLLSESCWVTSRAGREEPLSKIRDREAEDSEHEISAKVTEGCLEGRVKESELPPQC
jgi:hypothetical protein